MNRVLVGLFLTWVAACSAPEPPEPAAANPPNIVLIISDDHGYGDFGFMGSTVAKTPNIDRLAQGGTVFPVAYNTGSTCRPSLSSLVTGLDPTQWQATSEAYEQRHPGPKGKLPILAFETLPRLLRGQGYAALQTGKFWLGTYAQAGFSDGLKTLHADSRWSKLSAGGKASLAVGRTTLAPVTEFIDAHVDQPFFIWFAPMLPHVPFDAPQHYRDRYADAGLSAHELGYFANVSRLDDSVGALVSHLEAAGVRERTLIVFLADNGWEAEKRDEGEVFAGGDKGKASIFELGWRTPLIFNWPAVIAAGETRSSLASTLDLFPTLLDYAQVAAPPEKPGRSLRPVLEGAAPDIRTTLFGSDQGYRVRDAAIHRRRGKPGEPAFFARTKHWRYIWRTESDSDALYDMRVDPREEHNLAEAHPEKVQRLREEIEAWHAGVQQPAKIGDR